MFLTRARDGFHAGIDGAAFGQPIWRIAYRHAPEATIREVYGGLSALPGAGRDVVLHVNLLERQKGAVVRYARNEGRVTVLYRYIYAVPLVL